MTADDLSGRVAVVTGGAGGIGAAICGRLAASGAAVVVGYNRSERAAQELVESLPAAWRPHAALAAPVTDSVGLSCLAEEVGSRYGVCDLLVNCAGTTRFVAHPDLQALDDPLIDEILATNVRGPFAALRAMLPLLRKSESALVVNISSIAAVTANGSNIMYCASKAAVDNMTKSLARALAPAVRVVSVSPGLVDTDFVSQLDPRWRQDQVDKTPLRGLARPEHVADAVVAAATMLRFTTGAVLAVDGGRPLV